MRVCRDLVRIVSETSEIASSEGDGLLRLYRELAPELSWRAFTVVYAKEIQSLKSRIADNLRAPEGSWFNAMIPGCQRQRCGHQTIGR